MHNCTHLICTVVRNETGDQHERPEAHMYKQAIDASKLQT